MNTQPERNWSGNYTYRAQRVVYPRTVEDIQNILASSTHVGVIGTRHTFNDVADTDGTLISLRDVETGIHLDPRLSRVTVTGSVTYGQLADDLDKRGYALHNMASLPHISVIGACMTGTHGSGQQHGNLATAVEGIEFIAADGTRHQRTRTEHAGEFDGLVVGLGAYGIVTRMTLNVLPRFEMRQNVYLDLPFEQALTHFDAIQSSAYSVSYFTDWSSDRINQVWLKSVVSDKTDSSTLMRDLGAVPASTHVHPLPDSSAEPCTEQMGVIGAWHDRLPHFRMGFTPSAGQEIQTEYFVDRAQFTAAARAVRELGAEIAPALFTSEIRTVKADTLWMSPCYKRDGVGIHFTWKPNQAEVERLTALIEHRLKPFDLRPHWGKLFTLSPERIRPQYERLSDFQRLVQRYDPDGKFTNAFLRRYVL
ncbi:MAG: FAD-binding protein [Chloroflexi bacterium]|nr:putative xylitol oxidase [Anaerolineae bacterium]RIK22496.1 MAG: FAD-binding protein [Chloroflexota bacterium]